MSYIFTYYKNRRNLNSNIEISIKILILVIKVSIEYLFVCYNANGNISNNKLIFLSEIKCYNLKIKSNT